MKEQAQPSSALVAPADPWPAVAKPARKPRRKHTADSITSAVWRRGFLHRLGSLGLDLSVYNLIARAAYGEPWRFRTESGDFYSWGQWVAAVRSGTWTINDLGPKRRERLLAALEQA